MPSSSQGTNPRLRKSAATTVALALVCAIDHHPEDRADAAVDLVHHESNHRNAWLRVPARRLVVDGQRHQGGNGPGLGQRLRVGGDERRLAVVDAKTETLLHRLSHAGYQLSRPNPASPRMVIASPMCMALWRIAEAPS